jgi:hypothetical protein
MQKLTITLALAVIALALGTTTITTTMQIQPAYSQPSHCGTVVPPPGPPDTTCYTPGQTPTQTTCPPSGVPSECDTTDLTHQQFVEAIREQKQACLAGTLTGCTVSQTIPP